MKTSSEVKEQVSENTRTRILVRLLTKKYKLHSSCPQAQWSSGAAVITLLEALEGDGALGTPRR